ncbi:MAG: MGDG synthase family glycosyltransferase [Bacillota bacterium]
MDALKKIFIFYANSGAGHRRAAEALNSVIKDYFPDADVRLLDALDYTTPVFRKTYPLTYLFMVNRCPWLWGFFYYLLDNRRVDYLARVFRRTTNAIHGKRFFRFMLEEKPDLVLTTHFLPNELVSRLKKYNQYRTLLITCITDYYPHAWWRDSGVDLYICPNRDLEPRLRQLGVPPEKITTIGLPIHPDFGRLIGKNEARKKLGLHPDQFTVLITSGGFGVGPIKELAAAMGQIATPLQVLAICGQNAKLQDDLTRIAKDSHHNFKIYGYIQNMHEFMAASDLLISKSGGLTATEAMAKSLPLIAFKPIPGQESGNCQFLLKNKAGLRVKNAKQARLAIEDFLNNPDKLRVLRDNMGRISRPQAAAEIVAYIQKRLEQTEG